MISGTRYRLDQQVALQSRLSRDVSRALIDISTRKRLQGPSDDPAAAARIADIQRSQQNETAWRGNVAAALNLADQVDASMETIGTSLDRAKTLMLQASNAVLSDADRAAIATELRGIAEDVAGLATARDSRGQPLYAAAGEALDYPVGAGVTVQAGATRAGVFDDIATAGGPKDLADILAAAAAAVEQPDAALRDAAVTASIAEVDAASTSLVDARADQGVRTTRLAAIRDRLDDTKLVLAEERSGLEDTDIESAVTELKAKMTALEAAQAVLARTSQKTLFDLI